MVLLRSDRRGVCACCDNLKDGIYTVQIERDWMNDKYDITIYICEECVPRILKSIESVCNIDIDNTGVIEGSMDDIQC